ncbi:MAG: D-aminoacyl-tRNA deacylase [Chitinophagales bacterium]
MKAVIQRVSEASVTVNGKITGQIGIGLLVLVGFEHADTEEDLDWVAGKIVRLRIFNDLAGQMNAALQEANGELLVVSQFTLHASTKKGNRPSFIAAAPPAIAIPLYEKFLELLSSHSGKTPQTGIFGADMKVNLLNNGPVTIIIDSKNRT